ncbi:MAG: hypothetical protein V3V30_05630 [Parvularculaceae bacterium]
MNLVPHHAAEMSPQPQTGPRSLILRGVWAGLDVVMVLALLLSSAIAAVVIGVSTLKGRPMGRAAWVRV